MMMATTSTLASRTDSDRRIRGNGRVVYRGAANGIRPDPQEKVSNWAEAFRIVPEIGAVPGPWRNDVGPYLIEPMDALSPDDPCERVVIIKPSQSGGSAVGENWLGFIMHRAPGPTMYVGPTVQAAIDWYQEKLEPTINATPVLSPARGGTVAPKRSRSGEGSTTKRVRFAGGFLLLSGANSAATLRQHSIRYMVRDDRSAWTDNADGEGDPKDLSDARLKTFRVFGLAKVLDVSSPKLKGADIDADYELGDKRRYYMACKRCGDLTDFVWEDIQKNDAAPFRCRLICPSCGMVHYEGDKANMISVASGACWIPTAPDADGEVPPKTIARGDIDAWRHRHTGRFIKSYAITGEFNIFERWDNLAQREKDAGDDPEKLQPFQNSDLGRAYEPKGEGPGWELLAARKDSDWSRGAMPAGVLYTTLTADVQADGLYWAILGWGPGKRTWHIDHGFLAGSTDVAFEGAWPKLDLIADRGISFCGIRIAPDLIGVDSGYNAEAVYSWVKRRHNALAFKGIEGWSKLPIGRAETPEVRKHGTSAGKARRHGMKVWLVGTYGLKAALMNFLARLPKEGDGGLPTGYQQFPGDTEEEYFRHLVSEFVATVEEKGEIKRVWQRKGPNHWLDCNIYGWALTYYTNLWVWTEKQWEDRARELSEMTRDIQTDIFGAPSGAVTTALPAAETLADEVDAEPAKPVRTKKLSDGLDALARLNR